MSKEASRSGGLFYPADRANPKVVAMEARAHAKIASLKMDREDAPDSYDSTEEGEKKAFLNWKHSSYVCCCFRPCD